MHPIDKRAEEILGESSTRLYEQLCSYPKIIGVVLISNYMIKKHGWSVAVKKTMKRKKYKYVELKN